MAESISKAYLLYVPIEKDYSHTIYFPSASAQQSYFTGKKKFEATNITYQRKDGVIRFPAQYDKIMEKGCNYVMYQNPAYSNKWFYAFIADMSYENSAMTKITLATDCLQTWMFDINIHPSFVEREHAKSDVIGENTIPEGLETGEFICNYHDKDTSMNNNVSNLCYIIGSTTLPLAGDAKDTPAGSGIYNGVYSGVKYFRYDTTDAIDIVLEIYAKSAKTDSITGLFMAPKWLAPLGTESDGVRNVANSTTPISLVTEIPKLTTVDRYTPRNNKLLTYPYCYLLVSNNNGAAAVYHQEYFANSKCEFKIYGALTPGCSIRLVPQNYKFAAANDEEGLNLGKFPVCNFTSDMYTNWLTQNSVNIGLTLAAGGMQIVGGLATMLATGGAATAIGGASVMGGVSTITNQLAQIHEQQFIPPQSRGNTNCGDVITASDSNTFHYYRMSIKREFAKILDEYFDMFGYKCSRVKVPEKAHRKAFWYTKTADAVIDGPIPQADLQTIKDAYNKGITFWRHTVTPKDYTQDNGIV